MPETLVVALSIHLHADLLGHAAGRAVLEPDERDHVIDLEVVEHPIPGGGAGLGCDALALAAGARVPPDLDLVDPLDRQEIRARGAEELAGTTVLDDPQRYPRVR